MSNEAIQLRSRQKNWPRNLGQKFNNTIFGRVIDFSLKFLYKSSAVAEMGDRLATIDMAEKWGEWGAAVPLSMRGDGSPFNTMSPAPRHTSYRVAS